MSHGVDSPDELVGYCRRLGHLLNFGYCRATGDGNPCPKILDCWHERFDVAGFLSRHGPPGVLEKLQAPPPPKLASLLDLVAQAKNRQ